MIGEKRAARITAHLNGEDEYKCKKKSNKEKHEDLHSTIKPLARG